MGRELAGAEKGHRVEMHAWDSFTDVRQAGKQTAEVVGAGATTVCVVKRAAMAYINCDDSSRNGSPRRSGWVEYFV